MAKTIDLNNIPAEKFALAQGRDYSHDKKLDTKPIGYFKDAFMRFCKNTGSVIGFIIIGLLVLFAIFVPFFTPFTVPYSDTNFNSVYPKSELFEAMGIDFWDGCTNKQVNEVVISRIDIIATVIRITRLELKKSFRDKTCITQFF